MNQMPPAIRAAVIERDRCRCTECGKTFDLEVHHIISVGNGGQDSLDNLRALCRKCHRILEPPRKVVNPGYPQIQVHRITANRLETFGIMSETYSRILNRLMDHFDTGDEKLKSDLMKRFGGGKKK